MSNYSAKAEDAKQNVTSCSCQIKSLINFSLIRNTCRLMFLHRWPLNQTPNVRSTPGFKVKREIKQTKSAVDLEKIGPDVGQAHDV